jgi:hypothetical protein
MITLTSSNGYFQLQVNSNPQKTYRISDYVFYKDGNNVGLKNTFSSKIILVPTIFSDWEVNTVAQTSLAGLITTLKAIFTFASDNEPTSSFSNIRSVPNDFYIAGLVNSNDILYKTDDYRTFDLADIVGEAITNTNEVIRVDNDFYFCVNYTFDGSVTQKIVLLKDCYIKNNEFKFGSYLMKDSGIKSVHTLVYNPTDDYLYVADRVYGTAVFLINKIDRYSLNIIKSSNFPNNATYKNATSDIRVFNNKLYVLAGDGASVKFLEISTDFQDIVEVYTTPGTTAQNHVYNQPFELYDGKAYLTCYDSTLTADKNTNIKIVVVDLITKATTVSGKITINNNTDKNVQTHWLTIYQNKLLVTCLSYGTTLYYSSICRIDIKTFVKEEELTLDFPVTDDNSIIEGWLYLNGESFYGSWAASIITFPQNNAKLLKINPLNFTERVIELPLLNSGYGSYGSINYFAKNNLQLSQIRALINP